MPHLLAKHPHLHLPHIHLPHINLALVIALTWVALAVAASVYDVGHMVQAW
jgi:hypothetical protein